MTIPRYTDVLVVLGLGLVLFLLSVFLYILGSRWNQYLKRRVQAALKMRRNHSDLFRSENGYSWDYVVVFKIYEDDEIPSFEQQKFSMKQILGQLALGGIEIRLFYSIQRKVIFCKLRVPEKRLLQEADKTNYPLPTNPDKLRELCIQGRSGNWEGLTLPETSPETSIPPYAHIYLDYNYVELPTTEEGESEETMWNRSLRRVYKTWPQYCRSDNLDQILDKTATGKKVEVEEGLLRGADRIKLIKSIISSSDQGGCRLNLEKLIKDKCILAAFPLHDNVELKILESKWLKIFEWPWKLETESIKNYFGEKIGLYFEWLGFYTTWLIVAAIVGAFMWINVASANNPNAPDIPYFAGFMAAWATFYLEFWKRREKYTAMKWGMIGFEEEEEARPSFYGETIQSPVSGKPVLHFSGWERASRSARSFLTILGTLGVVIGAVAIIFLIRSVISKSNATTGNIISSLIFAIQIQTFNELYEGLAIRLNDRENHRTDTEYEDALIVKSFLFQFFNGYSPLFYIAFFKPFFVSIDPCIQSCMLELQISLGTIFLTRLAYASFSEVIAPLIMAQMKKSEVMEVYNSSSLRNNMSGSEEGGLTEVESAFLMPEYDILLSTFSDYSDMVIQFGYTTMFVAAFPLATAMSFICNYVEIRIDSWKLCQLFRRPEPRSCEDIGTWYQVLEFLSYCSVFVNSGIVAYTGSYAFQYTWSERAWIFILMSAGLIGIKLIIAYIIPDIPEEVSIQMSRQEYIRDKLHRNLKDSHSFKTASRLVPKYTIQSGDDDPL